MNESDKQSAFLSASIDADIVVIDLHETRNVSDALEKLESELFAVSQNRERYCRVVYGIGEGVLRKAVLDYVQKHPLVVDVGEDMGGSCVVLL